MTDKPDATVKRPGLPTIDKMISEYKRAEMIRVNVESEFDTYEILTFPYAENHLLPSTELKELAFNVFASFVTYHVEEARTGKRYSYVFKADTVRRKKNVWTAETQDGKKFTATLLTIHNLIS